MDETDKTELADLREQLAALTDEALAAQLKWILSETPRDYRTWAAANQRIMELRSRIKKLEKAGENDA